MSPYHSVCPAFFIAICLSGCGVPRAEERSISLSALRDKIEGGWAGQMIGVAFGGPTEFDSLEKIIEGPLPEWKPENVASALNQDDLYVDMTFAQVLDDNGLNATTEDFGAMFRDAKYRLWHANLAARRALKRGVPATESGTPRYNAHANDIDFQIESDFIGLMAPGLPRAVVDLGWRAGRVMNHGDGIYGGMFVSAMYAEAFFDNDPARIVSAGLAVLPPACPYSKTVSDVLAWSKAYPGDWRKVWQLTEEKWNERDPCPDGALRPFNIDARLNGAYIALGLLHGGGDFGKTIEISTRAGQDSDCNPSNAAGVLGVVLGYQKIPEAWKGGIPAIADQKFAYTNFSFRSIADSTTKRAIALAQQNGGRVEGERLVLPLQAAEPARLEAWDDYGSPAERILPSDSRWKWKGEWRTEAARERGSPERISGRRGAEASIEFEGTGAILAGSYLPAGGTADVHLDGRLHRAVDSYSDEESPKSSEAVWHAFGLPPGKHSLRIVVRGEHFADSTGTDVAIEDLVVFR